MMADKGYEERIDAGEPMIDVIREAIDKVMTDAAIDAAKKETE